MKNFAKILIRYPIRVVNKIFVFFYYKFNKKGDYKVNNMISIKRQKILVLSPHVDDESIGLGGTIIKHKEKNDDIYCVYITDGGASDSDLSKENVMKERKKEAEKVGKKLNFNQIFFLDEPDGKVKCNEELSVKLYNIIEKINPDIIYTPFLIDGHNDHVETTKTLIKSLDKYNKNFSDIFMYEINCNIKSDLINSISTMDKRIHNEKKSLLNIFESQKVMGFSSFLLLNRMKRFLLNSGFSSEIFVKSNLQNLKKISNRLDSLKFKHYYFKQLSSEYNLLISFLKSYKFKKLISNEIKKILYQK